MKTATDIVIETVRKIPMKKILACLLAGILLVAPLSACGSDAAASKDDDKLKIVCTTFPQYDWVRHILGDHAQNVELTLLLDNGVDLHSFQPSVEDVTKITSSNLFIYVGGESEEWVEDALKNASNDSLIAINLMDSLGNSVKDEEIKEGMDSGHENEGDPNHNEESEADEHVWLSLKNTEVFCELITEKLIEIDPANAANYEENLAAYQNELGILSDAYQATVDKATFDTVVFGDRFPFRYLFDDYKIDYYAAFPGCSAETEASFETVIFLAEKMDELKLESIMVTESSDQKIAETIIRNTKNSNQDILMLDSMQAVSMDDINEGKTYLSIMENNLAVLEDALN